MRRSRVIPVALAAFTVAGAGCGGGDSGGGTLSKDEFIKQGDALCTQARKDVGPIPAKRTTATLATYLERLNQVSTRTLAKFRALKPPSELQDNAKQLLEGANARLVAVRQAEAAAKAQNVAGIRAALVKEAAGAATYRKAAADIGFTVCGTAG